MTQNQRVALGMLGFLLASIALTLTPRLPRWVSLPCLVIGLSMIVFGVSKR